MTKLQNGNAITKRLIHVTPCSLKLERWFFLKTHFQTRMNTYAEFHRHSSKSDYVNGGNKIMDGGTDGRTHCMPLSGGIKRHKQMHAREYVEHAGWKSKSNCRLIGKYLGMEFINTIFRAWDSRTVFKSSDWRPPAANFAEVGSQAEFQTYPCSKPKMCCCWCCCIKPDCHKTTVI